MTTYAEFLERKQRVDKPSGFEPGELNPSLFPFQADLVRWACRRGRACLFEECGLGKTIQQVEWARQVVAHTGGKVLILAPLAVSSQTAREAAKFGMECRVARKQEDVRDGVTVTNYEMLDHFDAGEFVGVVLDESSILKNYTGAFRNQIISTFAQTPYRLACTATPAPNDYVELGNHAEFVGAMTRTEMLSMFFVHDGGSTQDWRIKGHAAGAFWKWVCSWAAMVRKPSDLGYPDDGFELPPLKIIEHIVEVDPQHAGLLFDFEAKDIQARRDARRASINERVAKAAELASDGDTWLLWCDLNAESEALAAAVPGAVEVTGSDDPEDKERALLGFADGAIRALATKPSIAGHGMNWQRCARMAFVGLSDSYEALYQAMRRCYRYGQTREVEAHIITASTEGAVLQNIKRKEEQAKIMGDEMAANMGDLVRQEVRKTSRWASTYEREHRRGDAWAMALGDCVEVVSEMPPNSVGYSVFSPPFASLYTYSASDRDMGNSADHAEFGEHFSHLVPQLLRVTMPGRLLSFHCMQLPTSKARDGYIGLRDFRGELIRAFIEAGWIYHSEVCIWKDPVTAMQRTKALGLLHKQLKKDSCMSRQGIADYVVTMRKPGDNAEPVEHTNASFPVAEWQHYASPIWDDINPNDTLQGRSAREEEDERHICLAEGSLVLTREGYVPIETVEVGAQVLTHRGRWRSVTAARCNGERDVIRTCAHGVADLRTTPDHRVWTRRATGSSERRSAMKAEPDWMRADELIGSYVNLPLPPVEESPLTADECWIIGRWLGDGHRASPFRRSGKRGGTGQFWISCAHEEFEELRGRLGDMTGAVANPGTATQVAVKSMSAAMRRTLARCGHGAAGKVVPAELLALDAERAEALLSGYLSADGCYVERYDRWTASSVSRALLLGMALVAQRARGVVASVYAGRPAGTCVIQGRTVNTRQDWIFAFRNSDGYRKSGWIGDDGAWKKVRRSESVGRAQVWDLQIEEDESFVAEGAAVHNCPLQLEVIRRCLRLWSKPGDLVLSPFAGIGSEGYEAVKAGRRFVGVELKRSYYEQACANLENAEKSGAQGSLFDESTSIEQVQS